MARARSSKPGSGTVQTDPIQLVLDDSRLATQLPSSLTVSIELPPASHAAPADEAALALAPTPITADLGAPVPATTSLVFDAHTLVVPPAAPSEPEPESAAMLTDERLIADRKRMRPPAPEGFWQQVLYQLTFHGVNVGDSRKVRARKALDARIAKRLDGGARFIPVLTRKGGVGKTTITTLLGMALADVRDDRVIAIDANPDRGTLSERVNKQTRSTVRDVVHQAAAIRDFTDFAAHVSRDETRLDVLASDTDPMLSEAFDEGGYNVVADIAARHYSIVLTDCGTGIVHSVMRATLQRADELVVVSGGSVDEARLASETLTWLEANGYGDLVKNAVVAINTATQNTDLVRLDELERHFQSRVREVVRIPYDPELAAGSVVRYGALRPLTRDAARNLAAIVMDGLPIARADRIAPPVATTPAPRRRRAAPRS